MITANEQEIFNRADWWDTQGSFRLLHSINPIRLQWIDKMCGGLAGKRLLDFGCGGGIFAESAANAGAHVLGVDAAAAAVQCARTHAQTTATQHPARQLQYQQSDCVPQPQQQKTGGGFAVITCLEMLEHTHNPAAIVADCAQALQPGGCAVFSTINRTPLAYALAVIGLERIARALPAGSHNYHAFVRPAELARVCKDAGLSVTDIVGLCYSPFGHHYYLSSTRTAVNYMLATRRRV